MKRLPWIGLVIGFLLLAGRSFAFTDPLSFSGHMAPQSMLITQKIAPQSHFSRSFFYLQP